MEQGMLDKLNAFWQRLGIKPSVGNVFVFGVVGTVAYWVIDGGAFNVGELRLLVGTFLLSLVGAASPPEAGAVFTRAGVRRRP